VGPSTGHKEEPMNLDGKISNPGEMRTQITLGQASLTDQSGGFSAKVYTPITTVWAKWTNVHGAEVWAAESVQASEPATVLMRYHPTIDPSWGIGKDGDWYDIVSLDDIQERHEYIELKVKRMVGG
jgi:SPP1 family predicted phage head-tail adaptor